MFFTISLYASLLIFLVGSINKIANWFCYRVDQSSGRISVSGRLASALKAMSKTLFSIKIFALLKIFLLDAVGQRWLHKRNFFRWMSHILIYGGFMLLLLMHALDNLVTTHLFSDYYATLNPFMFLRNFFGMMVLAGLAMVVYRRLYSKMPRPKTTSRDNYAIIILALIMLSGIILEAVKINSFSIFEMMASDYAGLSREDTEEFNALADYWVQYFGVVSPDFDPPFDQAVLQQGEELHELNCMQCHSRPQWGFISYAASRALSPVAAALDRVEAPALLWYFHVLTCFIGLAYLPFSKFFHIIASPLYLMASQVMDSDRSDPANAATLKAMALDACTHCGECTTRCSVATACLYITNPGILPSEKIVLFRRLLAGKRLTKQKLIQVQMASHICTDCGRCTDVCPMGIHLQELWSDLKDLVSALGYPKPENWAKKKADIALLLAETDRPAISIPPPATAFSQEAAWTPPAATFNSCFECRNCTNVCPVVGMYESPRKLLGLLPHEIMHYLVLKQKAPVLDAAMLWACTTCYLCQEQCPQGVPVTDLFYELKGLGLSRFQLEA